MTQVTIDEIKRNLSKLLYRVEAGETLLIVKEDKPVAELKPFTAPLKTPRPFGLCEGEFTVPDDFDAPLPENMQK
jgi:prevent-host-death family protein